jgi:hypothetical protein
LADRVVVRPDCGTICATIRRQGVPTDDGDTVRVLKGKIGDCDDDGVDRAVVYFGEPVHPGYVLIQREHLANVTRLEHERWKWAHREVCHKLGIE